MTKQVVKYLAGIGHIPGVGGHATVVPVDHPDTYNVTNNYPATTSRIVSHNTDTGEFETLNSLYVPVAQQ